jgi:hypothetical protein
MTEIKDNCVFIELKESVIAFIGLPSTLINSITGKRFLKSGICNV